MRDQIPEHVDGELGHGMKAGFLYDLFQLLVKRARDLESYVVSRVLAQWIVAEIAMMISGMRRRDPVKAARRGLLFSI